MEQPTAICWTPEPTDIAGAAVTELAERLGVSDFDALNALSIGDPERYWATVNEYCGIRWRTPWRSLCDTSRGKEFPTWFTGGELNWVETVLAKAIDRPRSAMAAVVAELEDGTAARITGDELRDRVRGFAAGLRDAGVVRGDRIGLLMENGIEATVSFLALSYIGAIVVPLFSGFGAGAVATRLAACQARGIIATGGFRRRGRFVDLTPVIAEIAPKLPDLDLVVVKPATGEQGAAGLPVPHRLWHDLLTSPGDAPEPEVMTADDPFMVIYTSGTTGAPKGAVHTHGGFPVKIAHDAAVHFNIRAGDAVLWPADMGWIAGALVLAAALMRGATLICYDGAPDAPDWSRMAQLIEKYRVTHFGSAPTLIRGLAANEALSTSANLGSLKLLVTAGETIAPEHFIWFQRHFGSGRCPVINYTGGTEASGALLGNVPVKPIAAGGFNATSPGVAADVVDAAGRSVSGEIGDLAVRAPFVGMTRAFWQDERRYLETYWQTVSGSWIHGDLALRTHDGYFFLLGRSDDTIMVAGKRVGPAEVEEIVVAIDGVEEAAVVGAEDAIKGQAILVFVTASAGQDSGALHVEIATRIRERLGKPFAPRAIYTVPQLPKTRSSKIMRRVIRGICAGTPQTDLSSLVNPEAIDEIRSIVRKP